LNRGCAIDTHRRVQMVSGSRKAGQRRHFGERTRGPRRKAGSPFRSNPQQRRPSCRH
jgi:hypothetical protein